MTYLLGETEANQRQSMTVEQVPPTIAGIQTLIESGCLRAAANLTHRLLTNYGQGFGRAGQPTRHSPHSLQLWFTRLALLVKLGEFDLCKREADAFGLLEQVDMYYEVSENRTKTRCSLFNFVVLFCVFEVLSRHL